jgi:chromosomal replication initiation ATPase DnaA
MAGSANRASKPACAVGTIESYEIAHDIDFLMRNPQSQAAQAVFLEICTKPAQLTISPDTKSSGAQQIIAAVGERFGRDGGWSAGRRSDDAGRAVAAYLARRRFGYSATAVAAALGYRAPSSVSHAVARVESAGSRLQATADELAESLRYSLFKL